MVSKNEFTWCLHCERVNTTKEWEERNWHCPTPGCTGNRLDAHPWGPDSWPMDVNPDYPGKPELGRVYPLYGPMADFKRG